MILISLFTTIGFTQTSDDFSDGDFTANPVWSGSTSDFIVNTSQQLQLNASAAGTSYLSTPHNLSDFENKEWNVWVRQNFAGSASNFGRIYLTSNSSDLTTNPDGIYLQLGEALSTDAVRLMQRNGGVTTQICASADGTIAAAFISRIKIIRDNTGIWSLAIDFSGGVNYTSVATGTETALPVGTHIGYLCTYTVGNINRFYLDDVYAGNEIVDTDPPIMTSVQIISANAIDVLFSEEVTQATAENTINYNVSLNSIASATLDGTNPALVHLQLTNNFVNGNTYTLTSSGIADTIGNISVSQSLNFTYLVGEIATPGDVIINEFMADPSPVVGLPEAEFVEIHNVSNKIFNIAGWKLGDNSTFGTITSGWLYPGEYKVLCPTINVPNFPNSVGVTSFPSLNNSSDDIVITDNNTVQLDKLTYNLSWYKDPSKQDGGWTIERINPTSPCSDESNWRASVDPNGGTPGAQNSVYDLTPDTQAPSIVSVSVTAPNEIEVIFNEPVDSTSLTTASVIINPNLTETNRTIGSSNPISFRLSFSQPITESQNYSITISGTEDCWGNTATTTSTFFIPSQPVPGDVIINEFMADPSPVVGLPEAEFVEIHNVSNKIFNIAGWKLGDNATFGTITSGWLYPGEYKVLCPAINVPDFPNSVGVTSFPSLNNSSDDIVITDNNTVQLDKLTYNLSWYKDLSKQDGGWTIERINPTSPCSNESNWRASVDPNGGTPGAQNSVYDLTPDTQAPSIVSVSVTAPNEIEVIFNEPVDSTSLTTASVIISPNLTETNRTINSSNPISFRLSFSQPITESQNYSITISGAEDCWGNTATTTSTFFIPSQPNPGDIIINEFMADPSPVVGLPEAEFVEIHNVSNKIFNITGWRLGDNATFGTITSGWLYPGEYKVLCPTVNVPDFPNSVGVTSFPSLNNSSDDIVITDNNNVQLDKISYTLDWYQDDTKKDGGWTIERINPITPCSQASNWRAAVESTGGTPGVQNSVYDVTPDTSAPFISSAVVMSSNNVEITFNKPVDSTSLSNASITTNPSLTEVSRTISGLNPISFDILFSQTILASQNYTITINNIQDCWGNTGNTTAGFILPAEADSGDVVLNEVLFDQYTGGSDWIELYNQSDKVINLRGWKIARFNTNGVIADHKTISSNYLLKPQDYVVIGGDSSFVITNYPATVLGKFYQLSLPTLANDTGSVIVFYPKDTLEVIMDQLIYSSKWHFKLIDSKDGKSLERMDPNLPTQSPTNWHTAAEAVGFATPGGKNSQYYPALYNGEVNLTSETVSPDNDGFEDVLQINYQMNTAGMLATITIFDDRGRIIKTVTQNELLGINGTIIWDGIREDGQKATIGTYVMLMQAFDINGGSEFVSKKAFVVAGKM